MDFELVRPSVRYEKAFFEALRELPEDSQWELTYTKQTLAQIENDFPAYVTALLARETATMAPLVHDTINWAIAGERILGRIAFRHRLNDFLKNVGGHIGFAVRPSARREGVGTRMLEKILMTPIAKRVGRVLVTCDETNAPSRKIIEKNGGIYSGHYPDPEEGTKTLHFWIDVNARNQ